MALVLVVALVAAYFGRRWQVDTYRARRNQTIYGRGAVTTRRTK